ncbi:PD-(D/E)XK nuclease family protein [Patescibacteria group bacterium]|nr:PD-(D/E)XK nuclease family protein [Patescibacteria group bacterium]MDE1945512.1 PD-(D/E)XK nuclease family protein [Patescibacteria group bacterium]
MSARIRCPYCGSPEFVKRGIRRKKHEAVQLYLCRAEACGRTFTSERVKGKRYPLRVIIEGMSYYNLGCTLEETCRLLKKKFADDAGVLAPTPETLAAWVEQYKPLCRYERMRPYAVKLLRPAETVEVVTMAHRQLYRFRYHRAKMFLSLEEFGNRRLERLKQYLDAVSSETPHQYFDEGARMSEVRSRFDAADMIVKGKHNFANDLAAFVLPAVERNLDRHEALQRFMIANDSVTVATEVPVYIRREDVEHLENELKFKITDDGRVSMKGDKQPRQLPQLLTGHIDLVQVRNGMVHILDYKPGASKERPVEQLTWYALALSRLTGLRLFEFKCAWFDDQDYYEFYPLHVVKKLRPASGKKPRRRYVHFRDGTTAEVPREHAAKPVIV